MDINTIYARTCFSHLAGKFGVALYHHFIKYGFVENKHPYTRLTQIGQEKMLLIGLIVSFKQSHIKNCLDGSEKEYHMAGPFGRLLTRYFFKKHWIKKRMCSRSLIFTSVGREKLEETICFVF